MQDKMKKLLDQIGMNSDYLEKASIKKIVVYDNNKLWNFIIENDKMCKKIAMSAKKNMNNYSCDKIVSKWFEFMKEVYKNEKNN